MGGASSKAEREVGGGHDIETRMIVRPRRTIVRPDHTDPDVMDSFQAARYLHLHPKTVAKLAKRGIIPGRQLLQKWRFSKATLDKWLEGD